MSTPRKIKLLFDERNGETQKLNNKNDFKKTLDFIKLKFNEEKEKNVQLHFVMEFNNFINIV